MTNQNPDTFLETTGTRDDLTDAPSDESRFFGKAHDIVVTKRNDDPDYKGPTT